MADAKTTAKATPAAPETKPEAKATTAAPVDMDALKAEIRAEAEAEIRAEIVERQEAEAQRQAELDAQNSELDEVVCMIENVHTSKGKMTKGATKNLPKAEADVLASQHKVKRT